MIERISFVCEGCGEDYADKEEVHVCALCGEDYCGGCARIKSENLGVCNNCYNLVENLSDCQIKSPDRFFERLQELIDNI